jgi:hypothetical protein
MSLQGQIKEFGLSEIFQLIQIQKREGVLTLRQGKNVATVLFDSGALVLAKTGTDDEWIAIASLLVRARRLTPDQLSGAIKRSEGRSELGPFLVEKGILKKEDVQAAAKLYIEEVLFQLFTWRSGDYQFQARTINYNREYLSPINMDSVLMEVMQRLDEWPLLRKRIPVKGRIYEKTEKDLLQPEAEKKQAQEEEFSLEDSAGSENGASQEKRLVYDLINGERSVSMLVDLSMLGEFPVYKILSELDEGGYIKASSVVALETGAAAETRAAQTRVGFFRKNMALSLVVNCVLLLLIVGMTSLFVFSFDVKSPSSMDLFKPFHQLTAGERMDRIQYALHVYYLHHQHFPRSLDLLVEEGEISSGDALDPWGRPWKYLAFPDRFQLGFGGRPSPSVAPSVE